MLVRLTSAGVSLANACAMITLASGVPGIAAQSPGALLELAAVRTFIMPPGYEVTGASITRGDTTLVWSMHSPQVMVCAEGECAPIDFEGGSIVAAAIVDGGLETVDAGGLVRVSNQMSGGTRVHRLPYSEVISAAHDGQRWIFVAPDPEGLRLVRLSREFEVDGACVLETIGLSHVVATQGTGFVQQSRFPFAASSFNSASTGLELRSLPGPSLAEADTSLVALPRISLDGARSLVTFADLRSDRRVIILFGPDGSVLQQREISSPVGFLAADAASRRLVGVRYTGQHEVVVYSWRWSNEGAGPQ